MEPLPGKAIFDPAQAGIRSRGSSIKRGPKASHPKTPKQAPTMPSFRRRPGSPTGRRAEVLACRALVAFVGMTLRKNGPRASSPAEAGSNLAVLPAKAGIPDRPQGRSVGLSWMPTFVGMTLRIGRRPPCLMLALGPRAS